MIAAGMALCAVVLAIALVVSGRLPDIIEAGRHLLAQLWTLLGGVHPLVFFGALAILPSLGAPISPFYFLASAYGAVGGLAGIAIALAINLALGYWLSCSLLRPPIERLIRRSGFSIPEVPARDAAKVILLVRCTPGLPYVFQTYLLGLARVPFLTYMAISLTVQMGFAIAFLLFGDQLVEGRGGVALAALCAVIVLSVGFKMLYDRLQRTTHSDAATPE